jgi:hypothetical protein
MIPEAARPGTRIARARPTGKKSYYAGANAAFPPTIRRGARLNIHQVKLADEKHFETE